MATESRQIELDDVNRQLLRELQADPRITMSALARQVGMSAPAVTERVQRLERSGVIAGYRVDIDPAALGIPVAAYARIRPVPGQLPKIAALAKRMPEVSECRRARCPCRDGVMRQDDLHGAGAGGRRQLPGAPGLPLTGAHRPSDLGGARAA